MTETISTCQCCDETFPSDLVKPLNIAGHDRVSVCGMCAWEMMRKHWGLRKESPNYPTEAIAICVALTDDYRRRHGRGKHVTE